MINWSIFENSISSYLNSKSAKGEEDLANYIADKYDTIVRMGTNQYNQGIVKSNKNILASSILMGLKSAKQGKNLNEVSKRFSSGILLYWGTVIMNSAIPPPGAISVISNNITFFGIPIRFNIYNTLDSKILAKSITLAFKAHIKTVQGVCTALVPSGGGTIVVPYHWSGLK